MRRNWPRWIGYLTAAVSLVYGLLGVFWSLGGAGFPFGSGDPELTAEGDRAIVANLLGYLTPTIGGPVVAALGLLGAGAALLMARAAGRGVARAMLLGFAITMAIGLSILIQDYRPLILVAYTLILSVSKPLFGWPAESGFDDLYSWPRLNLLILLLLGVAWALTAVSYRRRTADACGNCGRDGAVATSRLARWGKPAVIVAVVTPLIYCATRWIWALGINIGMDPAEFAELEAGGMLYAAAALATMGCLGAVLTLGLIQRWGEVFPRWIPILRGRRVPPMLAVVPALLVAVLVTAAGTMYIRLVAYTGVAEQWVTGMPETLWPLWGAGLFVAALSYHYRRRLGCGVCGRG